MIKDKGDFLAFPNCIWVGDHHAGHSTGMTLRDWFAGMAIQGILANPDISEAASKVNLSTRIFRDSCVDSAFKVAEAMLRAREEEK